MASATLDRFNQAVPAPTRRRRPVPVLGILMLTAVLAVDWYLAAARPGPLFSISSVFLFAWLLVLVGRISTAGLVVLMPLIITRSATLLSLLSIEAGAYMPEVGRIGEAGDASVSFVALTAVFFLVYAFVFRLFERPFLSFVRSPLLDEIVALLAWPALLICAAWGAVAFLQGVQSGFPLLQGVDRFLYRREFSSPLVLMLLDQKFLVAAILGSIAFSLRNARLLRVLALMTLVGLTGLYFLFGDKFFTILTEISFFIMPLLLQRLHRLKSTILRLAPLAVALFCGSLAATMYIYSDYGRLPPSRAITTVGERIAGQGELWFVASRDSRKMVDWDENLVARYRKALNDRPPKDSASALGIETFYFIQHYAPAKLAAAFRKNEGWVQLTMGYEAMLLVMFGYVGVAVGMALAGALIALFSLFLRRTFESGFPISLYFSVWAYLQVYLLVQQARLWSVAAPGQMKRMLVFAAFELVLLALNRGQILQIASRRRVTRLRRASTPA